MSSMEDVSVTIVAETRIRPLASGDGQVYLGGHNLLRNKLPYRDLAVLVHSLHDGCRRSYFGCVVFETLRATPSNLGGLS